MTDNIFASRRAFAYLVDIRNLFLSEVDLFRSFFFVLAFVCYFSVIFC